MLFDGFRRSGQVKVPRYYADVIEEVVDRAKSLGASFTHLKGSANTDADCLA